MGSWMFPTDVEYVNITLYLWVIAGCVLICAGVIILCYVYKRCGVADKLFVWMVTNGYTCYSHRSVSQSQIYLIAVLTPCIIFLLFSHHLPCGSLPCQPVSNLCPVRGPPSGPRFARPVRRVAG